MKTLQKNDLRVQDWRLDQKLKDSTRGSPFTRSPFNRTMEYEQMNIKTLKKIRESRTAVNDKSDKVHAQIVRRKVNQWVSSEYLSEQQIEEGLSFHDLCIFLFMIKMSRGYEDERLIL